jgi:glycosyltransferase involved in cell wall biosynthesis
MNKLSIIIPCYNEEKTILSVINEIDDFKDCEKEIIVVDDGSSDNTKNILKDLDNKNIKIFNHDINYGKGKAIQTGIRESTGDIIVIQDADLEYSPKDYPILIKPFKETDADVVYGSRFLGGTGYVRLHYYLHFIANKILTHFCNIFTNLNMTDMETGFKVFKSEAIKSINLKENSFGIEPEITIKLAKKKFKFYEVAVSYRGRSYSEGKKITLKDAFWAVYCILRYRFFD